MSEGDSPHGGSTTSENDLNNSLINKVRSRVSSIIPSSFTKWFSPSSVQNDSNNGRTRRRRESSSESEDENLTANINHKNEIRNIEPPIKRSKPTLLEGMSSKFISSYNSPGTSGNFSNREISNSSYTKVTTHRMSSTPNSAHLNRNRKYLLNKRSTQYDFLSRNPNLLASTNQNVDEEDEEELEETEHINDDNIEDNIPIKNYKSNHEKNMKKLEDSASPYTFTSSHSPSISNRKILNIPHSNTSYRGLPNFRRSTLNSYRNTVNTVVEDNIQNSTIILEDEEDQETVDEADEITLPIIENEDLNINGAGETPSESEVSINSYTDRPESRSMQNDDEKLNHDQFSNVFCHRNETLNASSTGINFSSHLQTEKSLFSDKNLSSLNNSTMSLNSWTRRPSFNATLYGSTSALSDSRLMNVKSPFYDGKTMYGGSSTYRKNLNQMQKSLKVPVQIRPSSSLSMTSNNSAIENNPALSNTAKRILELMNQFTSPLIDAKKMGNTNSCRILPLSKRQRFSEDELQLNRSIRLNSAKTPYKRSEKELNKSITTELQIPTVSQLIQMKKLQNDTENVRQLADGSQSILNTNKLEYQLPSIENNRNEDNKQFNKIRNKISGIRKDKKSTINDIKPPEVNLSNISFPTMKEMPKIDIFITQTSANTNITPTTSNVKSNISNISFGVTKTNTTSTTKLQDVTDVFKFSNPITIAEKNSLVSSNAISGNDFTFSKPIFPDSLDKNTIFKKNNESALKNINSSFIYNKVDSKKQTEIKLDNKNHKAPELKFEGSVMDALKKFSTPANQTKPDDTKKEINLLESTKTTTNIPALNTFGDKFKPKVDTWECNTCMVRNKTDCQKCVACETPKTGSQISVNISNTNSSLNKPNAQIKSDDTFKKLAAQQNEKWECSDCLTRNEHSSYTCLCCTKAKSGDKPVIPQKTDDKFKQLISKQNEKWECSTCMTRNDLNRTKCVCCEQAKPGEPSDNVPKFSFGTKPTASGFTFGIQPTNEVNTIAESSANIIKTHSFTFGVKATAAATTSSLTKPAFTFGNLSNPVIADKEKPALQPSGGFTSVIADKEKPALQPSGGFTFGKANSTTESPKVGFTFGTINTTISTVQPTNSDTVTSVTTTTIGTTIPTTTTASTIGFGSNAAFGKIPKNKTVEPAVSIFGSVPKDESPHQIKTSDKPSSTIEPEKTTAQNFGGFAFGKSPSNIILSSSTLGTPVTTTTSTPSTFDAFTKPMISPSFLNRTSTLNTSTENKIDLPFGRVNTAPITSSSVNTTLENKTVEPSIFGVQTNKTADEKKEFGNNFKMSNTANPFGNLNSTSNKAFNTANPSPSPFTFNPTRTESTTSATAATTTNSIPFAFGSATNQSTAGASGLTFGSGISQPTLSFGQPASNNTTTHVFGSFSSSGTSTQQQQQIPAPTFGTTNSFEQSTNVTKAFGSPSMFGASTQQTPQGLPSFGSPSNIFGSQATSTTFGASTANVTPSFGTPSSVFDQQNQSSEPEAKKSTPFNFGGNVTNETTPFAFGQSTTNNTPAKLPFSFSASATPSFNFGSQTQNTTQPFAFGATPTQPQQQPTNQAFNYNAVTEITPNAPFQFGGNDNNPFTATGGAANQQNRRKVRATRRLTPR